MLDEAHRAAIRRLQTGGVAVIPVSVMTLGELAPIAAELGLERAMVIEAGGAIARWSEHGWDVEACGPSAETLLDVIREIEERSGAQLHVDCAAERCYSEPFAIESGDADSVIEAASALGFTVRRGRRFFHLCRACDEGEAFTRLREELQCDLAIAIGDSPLDAEFLSRADVAIVVPAPSGELDRELIVRVPDARIARAGWAKAIDDVMRSYAIACETA